MGYFFFLNFVCRFSYCIISFVKILCEHYCDERCAIHEIFLFILSNGPVIQKIIYLVLYFLENRFSYSWITYEVWIFFLQSTFFIWKKKFKYIKNFEFKLYWVNLISEQVTMIIIFTDLLSNIWTKKMVEPISFKFFFENLSKKMYVYLYNKRKSWTIDNFS